MAIMAFKRLANKFYVLFVLIMLSGILLFSAMSLPNGGFTITNSGTILNPIVGYTSEIRAVFVHAKSFTGANWDTIANTLASYGINTVALEILGNDFARYPSAYITHGDYNVSGAVAAFHNKGIKVYADMGVMAGAYAGDGIDRKAWAIPSGGNINNLAPYNWLSIANPASTQLLKNLVQEVVTKFPVDGFMFDYTRWDSKDMPYDNASRTQFISDTGLSDVNWPTDVVDPSLGGMGKYFSQFLEWRANLVSALVKNMTSWMLAINPNLEFTAAAWDFGNIPGVYPTYWRYWIGQDTTYWISQGYLDWVCPMNYGNDTSGFATTATGWEQYATGGTHGKVGLVPFITDQINFNRTTADIVRYVSTLITNGADGFIIWEYGGPGDNSHSGSPDITSYLSALNLQYPPTFSIGGISEQNVNSTSLQITWITSLPATSNVEYSTSPLFNASYLLWTSPSFHYWQVNHLPGTIIRDSANVTSHSITLTNLTLGTTYYFRVQSQDQSGTATSKVMTFVKG